MSVHILSKFPKLITGVSCIQPQQSCHHLLSNVTVDDFSSRCFLSVQFVTILFYFISLKADLLLPAPSTSCCQLAAKSLKGSAQKEHPCCLQSSCTHSLPGAQLRLPAVLDAVQGMQQCWTHGEAHCRSLLCRNEQQVSMGALR